MNSSKPLLTPSRLLYSLNLKGRRLLPRQRTSTFGPVTELEPHKIGQIYVINLNRQADRWSEMKRELSQMLDSSQVTLTKRTVRYPAVDAANFPLSEHDGKDINPFYTLGDQLFVEPQPHALPDRLELDRPIQMSQPEIAIAHSHIGVWRKVAAGEQAYTLILEDDVYFRKGFTRHLDQAWAEINGKDCEIQPFDILYLSYKEVKHGAQKIFLSENVFRPMRGLWHLSGYVLSRAGAIKLLSLLPCHGPVDLWINHQFEALDVLATKRSIINQRRDWSSTNSYSILPALTKIGVLDREGESLFRIRPQEQPVFAFGDEDSGLSSLAMALSMLGYRCCSDLRDLPTIEYKRLLTGQSDRIFNAYVNIGSLQDKIGKLGELYPEAKFIITTSKASGSDSKMLDVDNSSVSDRNIAVLSVKTPNKWKVVCEHLRCPPPTCPYPEFEDIGQRRLLNTSVQPRPVVVGKATKHDSSPWVVKSRQGWSGIRTVPATHKSTRNETHVRFNSRLGNFESKRWFLRDDTFAGNLALFRPSNVELRQGTGAILSVKRELLGVRDYSAASISSRNRFLFGRFEVELQAANVPGMVTGFFLHRDSPRQEIDVEIVGSRSSRLLANVFYNPGCDGANYDYGYRGSPSCIKLDYDASKSIHRYAIEWSPDLIRWFVDDKMIHERTNWNPTPIPQQPMTLHVNLWPSRSKELAGRLTDRRLPSMAIIQSISVDAILAD